MFANICDLERRSNGGPIKEPVLHHSDSLSTSWSLGGQDPTNNHVFTFFPCTLFIL